MAKNGANLDVIETLQSMIRGESVVLVAEQARAGGAGGNPAPKLQGLPSFRESLMTGFGMSYDAATVYIERYNDSVERINAVQTARAAVSSGSGDQPGEVESVGEEIANADDPAGEVGPDDTGPDGSTPLGDAQAFDYQPDMPDGDEERVAARGVRMTGNEPGGFAINPQWPGRGLFRFRRQSFGSISWKPWQSARTQFFRWRAGQHPPSNVTNQL
ncbi:MULTISPECIES: hypothetical protein [unclassified Caballeronia]|uniref:hypothetical protein n=1 Tax=unclassified Caballeronia TaxID=2646786 RepID=UPI00285F2829|nr:MULTISPECIES: hypothetical protein [unclassified Caballeronia]MDR5754338.1 hypothetical protein [Caballeronia sp. LZ024]MDR5840716.1 hypothetical protein [Caballeronia sp. LZ031]